MVQQKKGEVGEKLVALTATSELPFHNSLLHEDFVDNCDTPPPGKSPRVFEPSLLGIYIYINLQNLSNPFVFSFLSGGPVPSWARPQVPQQGVWTSR